MPNCFKSVELMMHLYSVLLCIAVHPKRFTITCGVSPQPPPVCSELFKMATKAKCAV